MDRNNNLQINSVLPKIITTKCIPVQKLKVFNHVKISLTVGDILHENLFYTFIFIFQIVAGSAMK